MRPPFTISHGAEILNHAEVQMSSIQKDDGRKFLGYAYLDRCPHKVRYSHADTLRHEYLKESNNFGRD